MRHRPAVSAEGVLGLLRRQLRHLPLVHLLGLANPQPDRPPEVLHQDLRLLHLRREHLRPHHGAEGDLRPELLRDAEGQRRLAGARRPREEEGPAGHLPRADEVDDDAARLAGPLLPDEAGADGGGSAGLGVEAQALDVGVGRDAGRLGCGLHLFDLRVSYYCVLGRRRVAGAKWGSNDTEVKVSWAGRERKSEKCAWRNNQLNVNPHGQDRPTKQALPASCPLTFIVQKSRSKKMKMNGCARYCYNDVRSRTCFRLFRTSRSVGCSYVDR